MALEQISPNIFPSHVLEAYYALQLKFNIGWAINQLIAITLPLLIFFTGFGSKAYDFLLKHLKAWTIAAFAFFFLVASVISISQSIVIHRLLSIKAAMDGSALPTLLPFLATKLPSVIVASSLAALAGIILCCFLRRRNKLTWLWLSVLVTGLASIALMLAPYFSETSPLGTTPIENEIAALASRVGIPRERIAKENCANNSECPPGHVIGLGPTKLMLLDERLTSRTPEDQLLQVVAHEAKHYLLDNDAKPVASIFLICVAIFLPAQALIFPTMPAGNNRNTVARIIPKWVPLVYGVGLAIYILLQPAITTFRRHVEFEADRFGLEFNRDNQAFIDIMRGDAASNPMLFKYTPVTKYFRATHPDISTRIEFAKRYQPWLTGHPCLGSEIKWTRPKLFCVTLTDMT